MKAIVNGVITLLGLILPAVMAQAVTFPDGFPDCGKVCVNNMLAKAGEFNCGASDLKCLCQARDFSYGIHDCSYQYCQNNTAAAIIVQYGLNVCASAGVTIPVQTAAPAGTGSGSGGGGSGSGSSAAGGGSGGSGSSVPVTTSAVVSVFTSGGSAVTSTVGSTTIYSVAGGGAAGGSVPVSTSSFTTVLTSGGSTVTSTGASTIYGSATAVTTSAVVTTITSGSSTIVSTSSVTLSSTKTGPNSSSSSGLAPQMTAAPAGLFAAAGLAALLL